MRAVIITASAMKKEISGKHYSGKCVTAFDLDQYRIVRFVSNEQGAPVLNPYCNIFHPLMIVDISIKKECPLSCQTENAIADYQNIKIIGEYADGIQGIYRLYNTYTNAYPSYMNDGSYKIQDVSAYSHSLEIICVSDLVIQENRGFFSYNGRRYQYVAITDISFKEIEGVQNIGRAYLAISIPTAPHTDGYYYKFIASIFPF